MRVKINLSPDIYAKIIITIKETEDRIQDEGTLSPSTLTLPHLVSPHLVFSGYL